MTFVLWPEVGQLWELGNCVWWVYLGQMWFNNWQNALISWKKDAQMNVYGVVNDNATVDVEPMI